LFNPTCPPLRLQIAGMKIDTAATLTHIPCAYRTNSRTPSIGPPAMLSTMAIQTKGPSAKHSHTRSFQTGFISHVRKDDCYTSQEHPGKRDRIDGGEPSPWPHEIEAIIAKAMAMAPAPPTASAPPVPKLASDIRAKIAELGAAYDVLGKFPDGPECDAAEAVVERLKAELCELEEQIPSPSRSYADMLSRR
jgi:hypothetical protein